MRGISHYRGDTWTRSWQIKDSAGAPVDLTGASARLHLRDATGLLSASATTSTTGLTITAATGQIDLRIPAATMAALAPGFYYFDLELTYADATVVTIEQVKMTLMEDYTYG